MRLFYTSPTGKGNPCTRPDLSLGGFKSSTVCPNNSPSNIFADISYYSVSENVDEFVALALVNETGLDLKNVLIYFLYPENCQKSIQIAPVAFNVNEEMESILTPYQTPYNATFYEANGIDNAINIGDLDVDAMIGIWFKKVIDKAAIIAEWSDDNLINNGNIVPSDELISLMIVWTHTPILSTDDISNIAQTTATCGGNITNNGDSEVTQRGVCWNTTGLPTINDDLTDDGIGSGVFVSNLTGLTADTEYFVRAYAINSAGVSYGEEISFTALV